MTSVIYEKLVNVVCADLAAQQNPTPEYIRNLINGFRLLPMFAVSDEEAELLARQMEATHDIQMDIGSVLQDAAWEPWLQAAKTGITPYYWGRYKRLLVQKRLSGKVISALDQVTDRIVGLLENPLREGSWDRRGMVVGHVQSGKTANYVGAICKAADAGYQLIVVIAGIHNNLRNQTQVRVDEGFVGRDSARLLASKPDQFVGVGQFDHSRRPMTLTNSVRDFNKNMATGVGIPLQNMKEPVVFVIKKNSSTLKNLLEWLREHSAARANGKISAPMLVIDDEADNASINIKHGKGEVSRINSQIRDLLSLFERSCYVGYTATPFANIFIDPDSDDEMCGADLFPRNFIVSLDPPSNYFGPERIFLAEDQDRVLKPIFDNEDLLPIRHKIDHVVAGLPPSLIRALRTFVVGRAIRLVRGHESAHCSMLVNASRFTRIQHQLRDELHAALEAVKASARLHAGLPEERAMRDPELLALRRVWESEFSDCEATWPDIQARLHDAAAPTDVVEVNSRSVGKLDYAEYVSTGRSLIAVGGFSLSRGLTLEGLMVSYFLRNSLMYDTLMQMGRWFGYRDGYDDLCRIWMPEVAAGWYAHIAESVEELRAELKAMEASGATPEDFGLKVRRHPDTLVVTARNKMGAGERVIVRIGLGGEFIETSILRRDAQSMAENREAARRLVQDIQSKEIPFDETRAAPGGYLARTVPVQDVIAFIGRFRNHPSALLSSTEPVRQYIEARAGDELSEWDVLFPSLMDETDTKRVDHTFDVGLKIRRQSRTIGYQSNSTTIHVGNNDRVSTRGVEKAGVDPEAAELVEQRYRATATSKPTKQSLNFPDKIYRSVRRRPLLIVHLLRIDGYERKGTHDQELVQDAGEPDQTTVAWSISFPRTRRVEEPVEYVVNATWLRENNFADLTDDDELAGDDD